MLNVTDDEGGVEAVRADGLELDLVSEDDELDVAI